MQEVRAKKALGQHFLTDENIARKIAGALSGGGDVLEVGCGMGMLTQFLLERPDIVLYGAEVDGESIEFLHRRFPGFAARLFDGAFLRMPLQEMFPGGVKVIGNFPYNNSSQIFLKITAIWCPKAWGWCRRRWLSGWRSLPAAGITAY